MARVGICISRNYAHKGITKLYTYSRFEEAV